MAPCGTQFAGEMLGAELEKHLTINNLLLFWPSGMHCLCVCVFLEPQKACGWSFFMEAVFTLNVLFNRVWLLLPHSFIIHQHTLLAVHMALRAVATTPAAIRKHYCPMVDFVHQKLIFFLTVTFNVCCPDTITTFATTTINSLQPVFKMCLVHYTSFFK